MRTHTDPWLELIIEQEVSKRLKKLRGQVMYGLLMAGIVCIVWMFGHSMWILGHKAACG
ncbi:hypothetical protein ACVIHC_002249 [Bradyrhizobium diazoefficiens]